MLITTTIIGAILLLVLSACFISLRMELKIKHTSTCKYCELIFSILKVLRLRLKFPVSADNVSDKEHNFNLTQTWHRLKELDHNFFNNFAALHKHMYWFFSKVTCEKLVWTTTLGLEDAAQTGTLTGLAWGIKNYLINMFGQYINWHQAPVLYVQPSFNTTLFEYHFHSIIRVRIGYAMLVARQLRKRELL